MRHTLACGTATPYNLHHQQVSWSSTCFADHNLLQVPAAGSHPQAAAAKALAGRRFPVQLRYSLVWHITPGAQQLCNQHVCPGCPAHPHPRQATATTVELQTEALFTSAAVQRSQHKQRWHHPPQTLQSRDSSATLHAVPDRWGRLFCCGWYAHHSGMWWPLTVSAG